MDQWRPSLDQTRCRASTTAMKMSPPSRLPSAASKESGEGENTPPTKGGME